MGDELELEDLRAKNEVTWASMINQFRIAVFLMSGYLDESYRYTNIGQHHDLTVG